MSERRFPVLTDHVERKAHPGMVRSIPWSWVEPFEAQALENHDQSLDKLASRGGLSLAELRCVVLGLRWRDRPIDDEFAWFVAWVASKDVLSAVLAAAVKRVADGHSAGCAAMTERWDGGEPCDCGHDELKAACEKARDT